MMKKQMKNQKKVILLSEKPVDYQLHLKDRALAGTAEGITISDNLQPDNPIVYANEGFERLTGYSRTDVLGRNCRFLQGEKTDPKTTEAIRQAIKEEKPCAVEILNYRKDGATFWNWLSITPIRNSSGRVTNFLGIQSDITKRKNFENALYRVSAKLEQSNKRMKSDLEDARRLQLAMLPKTLPKIPFLTIEVAMQTAQEVGGDYYDFYQNNDQLTFALGDATGHGLKAGTIVTATKALFNTFAALDKPNEILRNISESLKKMGFRHMYMAMLIAKIVKNRMVISSAGMPYTYLYRKRNRKVVEIKLKGMPLGGFPKFVYQAKTIELKRGDTLLFHSDGLSECFNAEGEIFSDARLKGLFGRIAGKDPLRIIDELNQAAVEWREGHQLHDDMTLAVIKIN